MITRSTLSLFLVPVMLLTAAARLNGAEKIAPSPVDGTIRWVYDYEEGRKLAAENGKPLMVVFRCER